MKLKLFLLSIFALLALVAYQKYSEYSILKSINSYESCMAAKGSLVQETYPATCITRLGSHFPEPTPAPIQQPTGLINFSKEFQLTVPISWKKSEYQNPIQYWNYDETELLRPPEYISSRDKGKLKIEIYGHDNAELKLLIDQHNTPIMDPNEKFIEKDLRIDGVSAKLIESSSAFGNISTVFIQNPNNQHIYSIVFALDFDRYKNLRDQILGSFKFTD